MIANRARRTDLPVEDYLHSKGKQYQQKLQQKERERMMQEKQLSEKSKINPNSQRIIQEKERNERQGRERRERRLARPIGNLKQRTLQTLDMPTFKPKISDTSLQILAASGYAGGNPSYLTDQNHSESFKEDYYHFSNDVFVYNNENGDGEGAVEVNGNEYTLLPKALSPRGGNPPVPGKDTDLYTRFTHWEEKRKRRLELEKQHKDRAEMSECSFKPQVKPTPWTYSRPKQADHFLQKVDANLYVPKVPLPATAAVGSSSSSSRVAMPPLPPPPPPHNLPTTHFLHPGSTSLDYSERSQNNNNNNKTGHFVQPHHHSSDPRFSSRSAESDYYQPSSFPDHQEYLGNGIDRSSSSGNYERRVHWGAEEGPFQGNNIEKNDENNEPLQYEYDDEDEEQLEYYQGEDDDEEEDEGLSYGMEETEKDDEEQLQPPQAQERQRIPLPNQASFSYAKKKENLVEPQDFQQGMSFYNFSTPHSTVTNNLHAIMEDELSMSQAVEL
jgi:hypothetical protein